jgi:hypothetical protein
MQKLERLGPVLPGTTSSSASTSPTNGGTTTGLRQVALHFGPDGVFVLDIPPAGASQDALTWDSLIERAVQHPVVASYFDARVFASVPRSSFAVVVPGAYTGTEDFLIKHGSAIGGEPVEVDLICSRGTDV